MTKARELDPITIEVLKNALVSAADEMSATLVRTSFNPILYELYDFCNGLFTKKSELIAEGFGVVSFQGTTSTGIKAVIDHAGGEDMIEEGDVFMACWSFMVGSHQPDVLIMKPIFYKKELIGYAANKAHWLDVAAAEPFGVRSIDMWQEGVIYPGVRIVKRGVMQEDILDIVRHNTRLPDGTIGDLTAQIAACEAGEKRLIALIEKYGKDTIDGAIEAIMDQGETIMRKAISEIPDGVYHGEAWMDHNGFTDDPLKIVATITVKGDEITIDTTGSSPQQRAPTNCPYASSVAFCRLALKMMVDPLTRSNEGHWRPMHVIIPPGTILNPVPPAPTWLWGWVGTPLGESLFGALAKALPERVVARSGGDMCVGGALYGMNPKDGHYFLALFPGTPVGQGASVASDGGDALMVWAVSGIEAASIEIFEERNPLLIEKWALRQNSKGPGKFSGGLGVERVSRALVDGLVCGIVEQTKFPAWGLFGGKSGLPNVGILWPGTEKEMKFGKITDIPFKAGEQFAVLSGGGGGWGDPFERDPQTVLRDVVKEYISLDRAREDYGVIIREQDGEYILDEVETGKLRKQQYHSDRSHRD